MKTTLSLIIPIYKVEAYIEACLCSVLQQLPDWAEVIIVDDGSPDDSIDIAEEVLCRYPQLKPQVSILRQHNQGLSEARNSGIAHAEGQHVGFLDSDDVLLEGYFSILGRLLADNPLADIVAFNAQRFSVMNNGQIQPDCTLAIVPGNAAPQERDAHMALLADSFNRSMWFAWARIYRKTLFDEMRFPQGRNFEDIQLIPQLYLKAERIVMCDTPLVGYRTNPNGITRAPKRRDLDDLDYAIAGADSGRLLGTGNGLYSILYVTTLKARLLVGLDFFGLRDALRETGELKRRYSGLRAEERKLLSRKNRLFYRSPLAYYLMARLYSLRG
ncbi:putative glycosyltransferase EpsJ [Serratia plymuthica]|uniref:Glycosyl transferase n=1 Tax=Serratia plymuthica S13 TaxID=1348660 RepID=S4YKA4_SERPL|nr:glycosyltransferase family 2 protein [Serratia plymuthica]AGP44916.1 glycosyl transferase [Serratia plymuthica S13]KYG14453.1 putative glycosyltransferase EpsJ [Serratia plymuthica]QPS87995.1 glycosyltransferase [Serratia plymuthica]QQT81060.1 glycosyltransferase [Serratia plymuthica]